MCKRMKDNWFNFFFKFSNSQKVGIMFLFGIIIILQLVWFYADFTSDKIKGVEAENWISLQREVDNEKQNKDVNAFKIYPFNPNFISDYKGYRLGMSVQEIDRLLAFRKQNKYVNSAEDFQKVTGVSDSLLKRIAPYFKFPDWVRNKKGYQINPNGNNLGFVKKEKIVIKDINLASKEDLIKINGVGEVISLRILDQKEKLGGFVSMEQMKEVWGLSSEVIRNLNQHFAVIKLPILNKIDVNNASLKELSRFYYFKYDLARQIVKTRSMQGDFKSVEDLIKINGFPVEKANIITLYLSF